MSSTLKISDLDETYPFLMDHLPEYFREKCEIELKESPNDKVQGLQELRKMARSKDLYYF